MPLSGGIAVKNLVSASRPPADDPRPTIAGSTVGSVGSTETVVAVAVRAPFPVGFAR
jgi:hypothetical protein